MNPTRSSASSNEAADLMINDLERGKYRKPTPASDAFNQLETMMRDPAINMDKRKKIFIFCHEWAEENEYLERINVIRDQLFGSEKVASPIKQITDDNLYEAVLSAIERGEPENFKRTLKEREGEISNRAIGDAVVKATMSGHLEALELLILDKWHNEIDQAFFDFVVEHVDDKEVIRTLFSNAKEDMTGELLRVLSEKAARENQARVIHCLFSDGRKIKSHVLSRCLHLAAYYKNVEAIRALFLADSEEMVSSSEFNRCVVDLRSRNQYCSNEGWDGVLPTFRELISDGRSNMLGQYNREVWIIETAKSGNLEILEILLRAGGIGASARDSAKTQAHHGFREVIHRMLDSAPVVEDGSYFYVPSNSAAPTGSGMNVSLKDIYRNAREYLSILCEKGIPARIHLIDNPKAIDLGGVSKQFISSLCRVLQSELQLSEGMFPENEEIDLLSKMGKFLSLLHEHNLPRSEKLLTGNILNPKFFTLVKLLIQNEMNHVQEAETLEMVARLLKPEMVYYSDCFDYLLNPTEENKRKYLNVKHFVGIDEEDPVEGSKKAVKKFINSAKAFSEGITEQFKREILANDGEALSLRIQGYAVTSDRLIRAIEIVGDDPELFKKAEWIKEKIAVASPEWLARFVETATGQKGMTDKTKITLKATWRDLDPFEFHSCFNSLDLPITPMEKELFFQALESCITIESEKYNIA